MMSVTWTPPRPPAGWRLPLGILLLLQVAILLLYRDTGAAMVGIWMRSETFTHAFVVPPIVGWLIWRKRGELAPLLPRPSPWALLPMAGAVLLWWLGDLVIVAAATQTALAAMLVASVPLVAGWRVTATLAFPLAFLFFAVPIGEFLTPTLMHWTAEVLVASLRMTGIPVYQEGQHLVIPSGRWAVVEACSGIRYLMATFMVGSLFAYLNYQGTRKRLIFVAISLLLPVVANWVRAYIIVMLGHLSGNAIATGVDHLVYGWVFFGVVILALFFIGARWADPDDTDTLSAAAAERAAVRHEPPAAGWQAPLFAALALLVLVLPVTSSLQGRDSAPPPAVRLQLPPQMGHWQGQALQPEDWTPHFPGASLRLARNYRGPDGDIAVHVAYYRGQRADAKLVSSDNTFALDGPWHVVSDGVAAAGTGDRTIRWRRAVLTTFDGVVHAGKPQLTVWRVYWLGGRLAQGDVEAKLWQAWQAIHGEPDDGAAIHLVSALPDQAAADQQLARFAEENIASLVNALAASRASR